MSVQLLALASEAQTKRTMSYVNYTEVGGLFGRVIAGASGSETVTNKTSLTIQTLNGVQFSKRFVVGALISVDWYKSALLLPVGAGIRYQVIQIPSRNVSLFASADAGYALSWLNKSSAGYTVKGGLMLNPGIGLRLGKPDKGATILSLSYKRQEAEAEKPLRWGEIIRDESRVYNRLAIRLGMSF